MATDDNMVTCCCAWCCRWWQSAMIILVPSWRRNQPSTRSVRELLVLVVLFLPSALVRFSFSSSTLTRVAATTFVEVWAQLIDSGGRDARSVRSLAGSCWLERAGNELFETKPQDDDDDAHSPTVQAELSLFGRRREHAASTKEDESRGCNLRFPRPSRPDLRIRTIAVLHRMRSSSIGRKRLHHHHQHRERARLGPALPGRRKRSSAGRRFQTRRRPQPTAATTTTTTPTRRRRGNERSLNEDKEQKMARGELAQVAAATNEVNLRAMPMAAAVAVLLLLLLSFSLSLSLNLLLPKTCCNGRKGKREATNAGSSRGRNFLELTIFTLCQLSIFIRLHSTP